MKILHITAMSPLSANSGIPVVLKNLTIEQNNIPNIEARVLSLSSKVDMMECDFFDEKSKGNTLDYLRNYAPDIVIFHGFYHIEFISVGRMIKKLHIPFFIEPHGSFGKKAMQKSQLKKFIANNTIFRFLIKDAKGFIYTINAERDDTVYHSNNIAVIPNGVRKDIVMAASQKDKKQINSPIFYFLGRYDIHHKGLDYLLDALKILDDKREKIIVRLYGIGNKNQNTYIRNRIKEFSHIDVKDMGPIYGEDKKYALENANILILTSRYEGSPITVLDALSYGNPCIVTPGTNVSEELTEYGIGWKSDLNPIAIANTILKAKDEYKAHAEEYFENTRSYVLEKYTWNKLAKLSIIEYQKLLNK